MMRYGDLSYNKREGTAGIGGQIYEIELCMFLLLRGMETGKITDFCLASNMEEAGDFDDAVFKYHYKDELGADKIKLIFLQAKHKETIEKEEKRITIDTLLSQSQKGDFILRKYLSSFYKIKKLVCESKNHPVFNCSLNDCEFIIYTNARLQHDKANEHISEEIFESDHVLNSDGKNHYYQLQPSEKVINALKLSLDYEILAKELRQVVLSKTIDMNKHIFIDYHFALKEIVIRRINNKEGMFRNEFFKNNQDFINSIFKEIRNKKIIFQSTNDLKDHISKLVIKLPEKFGNIEENGLRVPLPSKTFDVEEIKIFLSKLKLFVSQPNERQLGDILQNEIRSIYRLDNNDSSVFADVKEKVQNWWKEGDNYLSKETKFFQESAKVSFWFEVRPPTDLFTGREEELVELHNKITRSKETVTVISQMTSVSGLGGIGKTELARGYINKFSEHFDSNIIWINAESKETLSEGFVRLAKEKLNLNTKPADGKEKSVQAIVDGVFQFFSKRKCLFVFDNAVNSKDFIQFLPLKSLKPSDQKPYILITSREREWGKGIEVMDLFVLKLEEAIDLVKKGLHIQNNNQDQEIEELVKKLQCFPLTLRQSIAYIENENVTREYSVADYLLDYEKKVKKLLKCKVLDSITNDYAKTTFTTWKITINKIRQEENGILALEMLSLMAYIAPENIRKDFFTNLSKNQSSLNAAVRLLVKYSMINGEQHQKLLNIHRLVQEVIRIELNDQNKQRKFIKKTFDLFCDRIENMHEIRQLLPHLEVFFHNVESWQPQQRNKLQFSFLSIQHIKLKNEYLEQIFRWLNCNYKHYDPKRKIGVLEKILEIEKVKNGSRNSNIAQKMLELGLSYGSLCYRQKEKELTEGALEILQKIYGSEDVRMVIPSLCLSHTYECLRHPAGSKEFLDKALKISEKFHADNRFHRGLPIDMLTIYYGCLRDLHKIKNYFDKAIKCPGEQEIKELLESTIRLYVPQSTVEIGKEETECDWEWLNAVINTVEETYVEQHDSDSLVALANACGRLEHYQKQKELLERSLKMKEHLYDPDQFHLTKNLIWLAGVYKNLGEITNHIQVLERVLQIYEAYYGLHTFNIVSILEQLAVAYGTLQDHQHEYQLLERALKIKEIYYGSENFRLINTLLLIINVYGSLGDYNNQKKALEKCLKLAKEFYSSDNYKIIKILEKCSIASEKKPISKLLEDMANIKKNIYDS